MKKKLLLIFSIVLIALLIVIPKKESKIKSVLKTKDYSYLPSSAKRYIEKVYNDTGTIVLTEKNKKKDTPYLNPEYVEYLNNIEENSDNNIGEIPIPITKDVEFTPLEEDIDLPASYDSRNVSGKNYLTPLKNQKQLNICWAYTTTEVAETYLLSSSGTSYNSNSNVFSAMQLDYATSTNGIKDFSNDHGTRTLNYGGNFYVSSYLMANGLAFVSEDVMPSIYTRNPLELYEVLNFNRSLYDVNSTIMLPELDDTLPNSSYIKQVKSLVKQYGSAYVGTQSPKASCGSINSDGNYIIRIDDSCRRSSAHAMQIIGWDDNYSYSYCKDTTNNKHTNNISSCSSANKVSGTGAYILRNSWGDSSPYVYLAYDSLYSNINYITDMSPMSNRNWDNNYHGKLEAESLGLNTMVRQNFTKKINTSEKVQKVKFINYDSNATYKLQITSGNQQYTNLGTYTVEYPGIYTVDLSSYNILLTDSSFTVTVYNASSTERSYIIENSISVFTKNVDNTISIVPENSSVEIDSIDSNSYYRFYYDTKNIPSNSTVNFNLYNSSSNLVNQYVTISSNVVARNEINAKVKFSTSIPSGIYTLRLSYGSSYKDVSILIGEVDTYTITFYANDGSGRYETQEEEGYESFQLDPNSFTRVGYVFNGWNTKANGTGTNYIDSQTINSISSDLNLYAKWSPIKYRVAYYGNGGEGTMNNQSIYYDESKSLSKNTFTKVGYHFNGWNTKSDGSGTTYNDEQTVINLASVDNETISLYAKWLPNSYRVVFNSNGGTGTMSNQTFTYDVAKKLSKNTFTNGAQYFIKWNTKSDGSGISYQDEEIVSNLVSSDNGVINLYAIWGQSIYQVEFHSNGGSGTMSKQTFTYGESQKLLSNTFTRVGYTFNGWNTKSDGSGTNYSNQQSVSNLTNINNDVVHLYAKWKVNSYQVVFNSNGGVGTMSNQSFNYGESKRLTLNGFTRSNYIFNYWNTKSDGTGVTYQDNQVVSNLTSTNNGTVTLYAIWTSSIVPIQSIKLNKNSTSLKVGGSEVLSVNFLPSNATNKTVTWTSNKPSIVSVDNTGRITALSVGKAIITVKSSNNLEDTCVVTVSENSEGLKISYTTHVQTYGWQDYVSNGAMAGTSGLAKRLEAIRIKLENQPYSGNVLYRTHIQTYGWEEQFRSNDALSGTSGLGKRLEAIEIKLDGEMANHYDVYYRVHAQSFGWLGWARNGEDAGTAGFAKRLEGIEIKLVLKGEVVSGYGEVDAYVEKHIEYTTHVQSIGWQDYTYDGNMAGTSGRALRLEAIKIKLVNQKYSGNVLYRTHIQTFGWENDFKRNDETSGTSGLAKRLEAIEIKLDGEMANHYDIYYRVHAQSFGWLNWAKNGERAGTAGYAYRLEGIEIILVDKGKTPPYRSDLNSIYSFIEK